MVEASTLVERRHQNLRRLFTARHIAFVGGRNLLPAIDHCRRSGYAGAVWVVNPKEREFAGIPCVPTVADLPEAPDATFVGVPREVTIDVVATLARLGAGGVVAYAAGFAEIGAEGAPLQERLVAVSGELAVLGPNCNGVVNNVTGGSLWPTPGAGNRVARGAALITQSGGLSVHLLMNQRSVDFAYAASVGNQAMLGVEDCIAVLADDPCVTAIAIYLEGLRDVPAFSRAAEMALRRGKPIVVVKAGHSAVGTGISLTHTSSISGSRELYQALFDRLGVLSVESCTELLETVKLFTISASPAGRRLVIFTCSGGSSNLGADRAEQLGLELPPVSEPQSRLLATQLPYFAAVSNPLDYNTSLWGKEAELRGVFTTALGEGFDAGVLLIDYTPPEFGIPDAERAVTRALVHASKTTGVPAYVVSILPELLPREARQTLSESGIAPLQGLTDGMTAIAMAATYEESRRRLLDMGASLEVPMLAPLPLGVPPRVLDEWESKQQLAAFGLPVPSGRLCTARDAAQVASEIGFPVVAKVISASITHKTDVGAVRIGLRDAAAVDDAVAGMVRSVGSHTGVAAPDRFLIEAMVSGAVAEMIVGVVRHPGFGLALVIGVGGTLVELLRDSCTMLLPVNRDKIERALGRLKASRLLIGFRGQGGGDLPALVDAILAIARFAEAHCDRLLELDVNPLLVHHKGRGVVAVDALVRLADQS